MRQKVPADNAQTDSTFSSSVVCSRWPKILPISYGIIVQSWAYGFIIP